LRELVLLAVFVVIMLVVVLPLASQWASHFQFHGVSSPSAS
jgi:uncharacterized membrane protein